MAHAQLTFRRRDVVPVIKAVERAGHSVTRLSINRNGSIVVELAPPVGNGSAPVPEDPNEWDELYADHQAS